MTDTASTHPSSDEYAPYYGKYISLVPAGNIVDILNQQLDSTQNLLRGLSESQGDFRYAPDKWSVKEVIGHLADSERIFAYRALRFARNDISPLHSFEQDGYIRNGNFSSRTLTDIAEEFSYIRHSTFSLFKYLSDNAWHRRGIASDNEVSVRALAYIIAGHELHHLNVLKSKYL